METDLLDGGEIYESLTTGPAIVWGLNTGWVKEGEDADLVLSKAGSFFSTDPQSILLVMHKGNISLFDETLLPQLKAINTDDYSSVSIGNSNKYVKGDLPALIEKIKQFYPDVSFPVN
jgi:hypothetical protein